MFCKVTHCAAGRVSANTRPHQLRWGDWEMWGLLYHAQNAVIWLVSTSMDRLSLTASFMFTVVCCEPTRININRIIFCSIIHIATNKQTNKQWETKLRAQLDPLVLQLSDHHQSLPSSFCMVLKHTVKSYELTIPETVLIQPSWSEGKKI